MFPLPSQSGEINTKFPLGEKGSSAGEIAWAGGEGAGEESHSRAYLQSIFSTELGRKRCNRMVQSRTRRGHPRVSEPPLYKGPQKQSSETRGELRRREKVAASLAFAGIALPESA